MSAFVRGSRADLRLGPGWGGWTGSPNSNFGHVSHIRAEQPAAGADTRNPVPEVWSGVWTPAQYNARVVSFGVGAWHHQGWIGAVWLDYSGPPQEYMVEPIVISRGFCIDIPISPGPSPCYPNCDVSTTPPVLNVDDFTCFINDFANARSLPHEQQITHYANCDASTAAPVLNIDDFTCFINAFAAGCP